MNPDFSIAYYNRGSAYIDTGEYDRAIADFDRALALSPKNADVYYDRGLAYDGKLHYDLTIEQLTRILEKLLEITPEAAKIEDTIDEHKTLS